MDMDRLQALMENFRGNDFQWIKTNDQALRGKVVKCRDIKPMSNGRFIAVFDDGSQIDSSQLTTSMMMISGDTQPLSAREVESIAGPVRVPGTPPTPPGGPTQPRFKLRDDPAPGHSNPPPPPSTRGNMFAMFNSEESVLNMKFKVKLPNMKLLKMMYNSAEDQDVFLSQLSEYLLSVINKEVVTEAMNTMLVPARKKPVVKKKPTMEITEVDGKEAGK